MQPVFTLQYGEFAVADYLSKNIKEASVFIPSSAQEKGIDLLLYKFSNGELDKYNTSQDVESLLQCKLKISKYIMVQ